MNWAMLTAIGQLAAVLIGVPSIIYFAIQLGEQYRERRQSAVNALNEQWGEQTKELWQTRIHLQTEAFARVVDGIITRGAKPTAYSTYDLKQLVLPKDT